MHKQREAQQKDFFIRKTSTKTNNRMPQESVGGFWLFQNRQGKVE